MIEVLIKQNVSSLLDTPFGDYSWMRLVKMPMCKKYLEADIVEALVDKNNASSGPGVSFKKLI